jgi:transposase
MTRRHIPREQKELVLGMSQRNMHDREIRYLTGISERSMRYLRKTYRETGEVVRVPEVSGRPRTLDTFDANVSNEFWLTAFFILIVVLVS